MSNREVVILALITIALILVVAAQPMFGQSVLQGTAESMVPGTWVLLNRDGDGSGYGAALTNSGVGTGGSLTFASKATWDPLHKRVFFLAGGHDGGQGAPVKFLVYDSATNRWLRLTNPPPIAALDATESNRHGYRLQTVADGKFYRAWANSYLVFECSIDYADVTMIGGANCPGTYPPVIADGGLPIARGALEYFPDRSSLMYIQSNGDRGLYEGNISTDTWRLLRNFPLWGDGIVLTYNPVHKVMLVGGGDNGQRYWTIDASNNLKSLDDAPFKSSGGILISADPVTGKFVSIRSGYIYEELDITAPIGSQWVRRIDLEPDIPQMGVATNSIGPVVVVPIPEYGVLMYMGYNRVWLHKPGAPIPPPPPPPPDEPPPPPPTELTFAQKCALEGVLSCWGFDNDAQLNYVWQTGTVCDQELSGKTRYSFGRDRLGRGNTVAVVHNNDCIFPKIDPNVGNNGALMFEMPGKTSDEASGYWSDVFKRLSDGRPDPEAWIGPGSKYGNVLYQQIDYYFDETLLNTKFLCRDGNCGGWKTDITFGNPPNGASASGLQVVMNNGWLRGVPSMYGQIGTDGYGLQDVRGCFESGPYTEPPCIRFKANQRMQFTSRIEIRGDTPNTPTSRVQLWIDGVLAIDKQDARVNWSGDDGNGFGQKLISLFSTNKDATQDHPTAHMWADNYIASAQPIPMDGGVIPPPPPPLPINERPMVNAGNDLTVTLPAMATLAGSVKDDGLPSGQLAYAWTGPAGVSFSAPTALTTTASFVTAGVYPLTLTVNDGELTASDQVTVTVSPVPPVGDTTRPTVTITSHTNGSSFTGNVPSFTVRAVDPGITGNIVRVELWVDNGTKPVSVLEPSPALSDSNPLAWRPRGTIPAGSSHRITAKAVDKAGNIGTSATITVTKR